MVADVLDHGTDPLHVVGQPPGFHILPQAVAEDPSEILVSRKGQQASAVGQHSYEMAQQTHVRQSVQLFFHAVFLIQEPPGGTPLHLTGYTPVIEISTHGSKNFIFRRIKVVNYSFAQSIIPIKSVEQCGQEFTGSEVPDRVASCVCSQG